MQKMNIWKDGKTISLNCLFFEEKMNWSGMIRYFFSYLFVYFSQYIDSHSNSYAWNSFYGDVIFKPEENWNIIHFCPKRQRIGTFVFLDTWAQCSRNHFLRTILYFLHLLTIFQGTTKVYLDVTKDQLKSEWIYEVIVSPKIPTKNYRDFCPTL